MGRQWPCALVGGLGSRVGQPPHHAAARQRSPFRFTHHGREESLDVGEQGLAEHCRKKFVYVEPSRRVKEILEEELHFQREAKHPAAVALEGIWSVKKNFSIGSLKPVSQNRNGLLLQPRFYSRHAGMK
ncbi:PREDICTED: uncharacterized protein LOC104078759, partial [Fulmarus glacialis]|uniref:uncharacterized protein LOC104078759 n=1 Tax=Fulmarus glacialis TaxID=30455 RepID=UPI00051C32FA